MNERDLFLAALQRGPAERPAFLASACGHDSALKARVERLLEAHDLPGGMLDLPADPSATSESVRIVETDPGENRGIPPVEGPPSGALLTETRDCAPDLAPNVAGGRASPRAIAEGPGSLIGPYKLLQEIGAGGMGAVYMAEQEKPVRRRVALKIIKPGMDSEHVIARFEAERQALALMDHPGIARVFDAGATGSGRPYFVMELVQGVPITEYCDQVRLSPRARLELFVAVCRAIQHAHQKGIIHRDIKPSNVLVTHVDGRAAPKVIDFGIAKAIDQRLTERTLFTQFGAIVGTPEYMSPEQADLGSLDVDTRSDVYSLGVLLYELVTGSTPLDRSTLRQAAFAEVLRRIREEEPPRPSIRLSASGDRLASLSAQRQTEPARLTRLVRGDLDWIVMKALEKDRSRRYETAAGFARDVERYLEGDAVEACPPSRGYRLRKFARKNRSALTMAAALAAILILAAGISTWQAIRATNARTVAIAEGRRATRSAEDARSVLTFFQEKVLAAARPEGQEGGLGREVTIRQAFDAARGEITGAFRDRPLVEASILDTMGVTYLYLAETPTAIPMLERAVALCEAELGAEDDATLRCQHDLAAAYHAAGQSRRAISILEKALAIRIARFGEDHDQTANCRNMLAIAYDTDGRHGEAIPLMEKNLDVARSRPGDAVAVWAAMHTLANLYLSASRGEDAIGLLNEALRGKRTALGPDNPSTLATEVTLGHAYNDVGKAELAIPLLERCLERAKVRLGENHSATLGALHVLSLAYGIVRKLDRAIDLGKRCYELRKAKLGADHLDTIVAEYDLAATYLERGDPHRAIPMLKKTLRSFEATLREDHPTVLKNRGMLALAHKHIGRLDLAIPLFERTVEAMKAKHGASHHDSLVSEVNLGAALAAAGQFDRAIALLDPTSKVLIATLGADHPETLACRQQLALAHGGAGHVDEGLAQLNRWLVDRRKRFGEADDSAVGVQGDLAAMFWKHQRFDLAIPLFEDALKRRLANLGPEHPDTLLMKANLGVNVDDAGRHAEGVRLMQEALDTARGHADRWNKVSWLAPQLAQIYRTDRRFPEEEVLIRDELAAIRANAGPPSPAIMSTLGRLGVNLAQQQKWVEAESAFRECLESGRKSRPDSWLNFLTEVNLGAVLAARKRFEEAEPRFLAGYEGMKARESSMPPPARTEITQAGRQIVRFYTDWGKSAKVAEWRGRLGMGPELPADPFAPP